MTRSPREKHGDFKVASSRRNGYRGCRGTINEEIKAKGFSLLEA